MEKYIKNILFIFLLFSILLLPHFVLAQDSIREGMEIFSEELQYGNKDLRLIVADIINQLVAFLGIIAVMIILFAGFRWMLSGGNDEKVAEAKKTMVSGLIGLFLVLTSYSIANFVLNAFLNAITE